MASQNTPNTSTGASFVRSMLFLLVLSVILIVAYKYLQSQNIIGTGAATYTNVPEEYTINYVPADFSPKLPPEETIMAILTNPYRYNREFDELVYNINISLLEHVSNRMGLPDSLDNKLLQEYEKHHPYLRKLYFDDFIALQDSSSAIYEQWYNAENQNAIDILEEISGKYTCFLVNQVLTSTIKTNKGTINVKGDKIDTPCGVAMAEGLKPMIKRLKEKAVIEDFSRAKGFLEERVETAVAELATMEVTERKGLTRTMQTKVLGLNVSSTDIEISAISVLKVGFDLNKYFDINLDDVKKNVAVTLPEPQVISHEVYPSIDKLDIGWMREISQEDFNKNFNLLRREFRKTAYTAEVEEKAKKQAETLMQTMLTPLVSNLGKEYKLNIKFKNTNPEPFRTPDVKDEESGKIIFEG